MKRKAVIFVLAAAVAALAAFLLSKYSLLPFLRGKGALYVLSCFHANELTPPPLRGTSNPPGPLKRGKRGKGLMRLI